MQNSANKAINLNIIMFLPMSIIILISLIVQKVNYFTP